VELVPDPGGPTRDSWRSHAACLRSMPLDATHLLVLQDDAMPQPGMRRRLEDAAREHPERILLGFVPGFPHIRRLLGEAHGRGQDHVPFRVQAYLPLVCVLYPAAVVSDLLRWAGERHRRQSDDSLAAEYARRRRMSPLALVPCCCDHDQTVPSVVRGRPVRPGGHRAAALL
jgi:hypothetical protein